MDLLVPEWVETLPSTNLELGRRLRAGAFVPSGFVLAAREQTAGRGRYDRSWSSGRGQNLAFSCLVRTPVPPDRVPSLPMAAALAVVDLLGAHGVRGATVKWPNDVLVAGRKICGILAEGIPGEKGTQLILGIGLNVNMSAAAAGGIDQPATSLHICTGEVYDTDALLGDLLGRLGPWVTRWEAGGFSALRSAWERHGVSMGTPVTVRDGRVERTGLLRGFGDGGELLLGQADGTTRAVWAGDLCVG